MTYCQASCNSPCDRGMSCQTVPWCLSMQCLDECSLDGFDSVIVGRVTMIVGSDRGNHAGSTVNVQLPGMCPSIPATANEGKMCR